MQEENKFGTKNMVLKVLLESRDIVNVVHAQLHYSFTPSWNDNKLNLINNSKLYASYVFIFTTTKKLYGQDSFVSSFLIVFIFVTCYSVYFFYFLTYSVFVE